MIRSRVQSAVCSRRHASALLFVVGFLTVTGCAGFDDVPGAYVARNGLRVISYPNGQFEVLARPGTAGPEYFCAAGDYARVIRNARAAERVVVTGIDGPSRTVQGGRSMVFEIGPPGPRTGGFVTTVPTRRMGASFPVATAQSFCRDRGGIVNTL